MCVIKFGCFWCGIASMLWSIWINLWNIFGFMMFCSICLSVASGILQVWLYPNEKRIWLVLWILAGCWWLLGSIWSWNVWVMGIGPKEQYRGTCTCTEISFVFKSHTKSDSWEPLQILTAQYLIIIVVVMIMIIIIIGGRFRIFCKRGCTTKK